MATAHSLCWIAPPPNLEALASTGTTGMATKRRKGPRARRRPTVKRRRVVVALGICTAVTAWWLMATGGTLPALLGPPPMDENDALSRARLEQALENAERGGAGR